MDIVNVIRFDESRLRNEEHFQCKTEIKVVLLRYPVTTEKLGTIWNQYTDLLDQEDRMLEIIRKSDVTVMISDADYVRDETTSGLFRHIDADCLHFVPELRQAAVSLRNIKDHYQGITRQSVESQTASTYNMLQEFDAKRDLLDQLHLAEWVDYLRETNERVAGLVAERDSENATKPVSQMKQLRIDVDNVCNLIFNALETDLVRFPDEPDIAKAIGEISEINKRFAHAIAQRKGHSQAAKEKKAGEK